MDPPSGTMVRTGSPGNTCNRPELYKTFVMYGNKDLIPLTSSLSQPSVFMGQITKLYESTSNSLPGSGVMFSKISTVKKIDKAIPVTGHGGP
jgi:hypothetical protein